MFLECKKFILKKYVKSKVFRDTFKLEWLLRQSFVNLDHKLIRVRVLNISSIKNNQHLDR